MKLKKTIKLFIVLCLNLVFINSYSQQIYEKPADELEKSDVQKVQFNPLQEKISELEIKHKEAVEKGNSENANILERELLELSGSEVITPLINSAENVKEILEKESESGTEWIFNNSSPLLYVGDMKNDSAFNKKLDIKQGEDGNLYAMISTFSNIGPGYAYVSFSKSTNAGQNWNQIIGIGYGAKFISNISFLVESRSNMTPDSTRLIGFFTLSGSTIYTDSELRCISVKASTGDYHISTIATPSSGKTISHISAVSDGAFYESATYYGVVFTETDNAIQNTSSIRFLRTINWGGSWTGSTLITGYNDFCPSADFKEANMDSVCIAVERRLNSVDRQIRILTTTWNPSSNFRTSYITSSTLTIHENPCLTIKQDSPADSIMVTYTRNKSAYYLFSTNAGASWSSVNSLSNSSTVRSTHCSSSRQGATPFTICWQNNTSDSINVRKGSLGNLGQTMHKVNFSNTLKHTAASSVNIYKSGKNFSGLIYYSVQSPTNRVLYCGESLKQLTLKVIPQGLYMSASNTLRKNDTIKVYYRNSNSPYNIIDSSKGMLYASGYNAYINNNYLNDGNYFIEFIHKNSIKVWSNTPVNFGIIGEVYYDLTAFVNSAYGSNLIKVNNSPQKFALYSGDINQDGIIDGTDGVLLNNDAAAYNTGNLVTDLNGDDVVDGSDALFCENNAANFVSAITP